MGHLHGNVKEEASQKVILKWNKLKTQGGPKLYRMKRFRYSPHGGSVNISKEIIVSFFETEPLGVQLCLLLTNEEQEKLDW